MEIPFTKAHGARNDFLFTWEDDALRENLPKVARAICDRYSGAGADGWYLVTRLPGEPADAAIRLFNSDGSEAELSGNGTRCAAAFLIESGLDKSELRIRTGAGVKHLKLINRQARRFLFETGMGAPVVKENELHYSLPLRAGARDVTIIDAGNPQCALFVDHFDFDWPTLGAEIESHPRFPNRTNVSFVRVVDRHSLEVRFYERGAGVTMSSGTGSTGAAAAALHRGLVESPLSISTQGGTLQIRLNSEIFMTGPAEIVARGLFFFP